MKTTRSKPTSLILSIGVLSIGALVSAVTAYAAENAVASEQPTVVSLAFGWQPGMRAKVETKAGRMRRHFLPNAKATEVAFEYSLAVTQAGENLLVSSKNLKIEERPIAPRQALQSILQLASAYPNHTVTPSGDFLNLTNAAESTAKLASSFKNALSQSENSQLARHISSRLASKGVLESLLSKSWNSTVSSWAGQSMEIGAEYGGESVVPHPMIPGSTVRLNAIFAVAETDSCSREKIVPGCVQLNLIYHFNSDDLLQATKDLAEKLKDRGESSRLTAARFDVLTEEYTIIANPQTLIPYRVSYTKTIEGEFSGKRDGRREYTESTYTYQ